MDFHTIKAEHRPKLRALNDRLYELQDKVVAEMVALDKQLCARLNDDNDPLSDYEINVRILFYTKEKCKEGKWCERVLTVIDANFNQESQKPVYVELLSEVECWRDTPYPLAEFQHSYWFHCLYDHNDIRWVELVRISRIVVEPKVQYQFFSELTN